MFRLLMNKLADFFLLSDPEPDPDLIYLQWSIRIGSKMDLICQHCLKCSVFV
jgi:hypothetical protein